MASAIGGDQDDARASNLTIASTAVKGKVSAITTHQKAVADGVESTDLDASEDAQNPNQGDDALLNEVALAPPTTTAAAAATTTTTTTTTSTTVTVTATATATAAPTTTPPYWLVAHARQRSLSNTSGESALPAGAITLRDNDTQDDDRNSACWAKSVEIVDHIVVNGSVPGLGAFVVWNVRVETLTGSFINIRKRYSEFDDFRRKLVAAFPTFTAAVPELPPKSFLFRLKPQFLEKRRAGLQYFLNCILLNPEFSGSPVLKDFLFA